MTGRKRIVRVSSLSVAKVFGLIYGFIGLLGAMFFGVLAAADVPGSVGGVFLVLMPVLYALGGFIGGLILGAVYNVAAGVVGGVVIDLADEQPWE
jgi:hypothetical protein